MNTLTVPIVGTGPFMRLLRRTAEVSVESLALKIGSSGMALYNWETNNGPPDPKTLLKWAKALGFDAVLLVWEAEIPELKLRALPLVVVSKRGRRFSKAEKALAIEAHRAGSPVSAIALQLGATTKSVYSWVRGGSLA